MEKKENDKLKPFFYSKNIKNKIERVKKLLILFYLINPDILIE